MPQYFKGDSQEIKFDAAGEVLISNIALQLDAFLADAYESQPFGDIIFADGPLPTCQRDKSRHLQRDIQ
jgi:hypothetical protein